MMKNTQKRAPDEPFDIRVSNSIITSWKGSGDFESKLQISNMEYHVQITSGIHKAY